MAQVEFELPPLAEWQPTRDTLHGYALALGRIRRQLTPPQKHWWHTSLRVAGQGLSTAAIPAPERNTEQFQIDLDLEKHRLMITSTWGVWWEMPVTGQAPLIFATQVLAALETMGVIIEIDRSDLAPVEQSYNLAAVQAYRSALLQMNSVLNRFKGELSGESSQVQLWPHHFDLALTWLTGRKVPGMDPQDEEKSDEQMTFGFSTGDEGIPDAYIYATAYPWRPEMLQKSLPPGASWHTAGWMGGLLMVSSLVEADQVEDRLLHFLRAAFLAGFTLMV